MTRIEADKIISGGNSELINNDLRVLKLHEWFLESGQGIIALPNSFAIGRFLQGSNWTVRESYDEKAPESPTRLMVEICQPGKEITLIFPNKVKEPMVINSGRITWISSNTQLRIGLGDKNGPYPDSKYHELCEDATLLYAEQWGRSSYWCLERKDGELSLTIVDKREKIA